MAEYLWHLNREELEGKQILELGCGTGLPGILAAACGASVLLTDDEEADSVMRNVQISLMTNNPVTWKVQSANNEGEENLDRVFISSSKVLPYSWGSFSPKFLLEFCNRPWPDLIIAADCFYDNKSDFDAVFATLDYLFAKNPNCYFLTTYQVRSSNTNLDRYIQKWGFNRQTIPLFSSSPSEFSFPIDKYSFTQDIELILITPTSAMGVD